MSVSRLDASSGKILLCGETVSDVVAQCCAREAIKATCTGGDARPGGVVRCRGFCDYLSKGCVNATSANRYYERVVRRHAV